MLELIQACANYLTCFSHCKKQMLSAFSKVRVSEYQQEFGSRWMSIERKSI